MMLWERLQEPCHKLNLEQVDDGQGGQVASWKPGEAFSAAIMHASSSAGELAEKAAQPDSYNVTTIEPLAFHDVFTRESDGVTFRVVSGAKEKHSPSVATFHFFRCIAERWEVPNGEQS